MRLIFCSLVVTVISLLVLSACGDDPLKRRKFHCDKYVENGHLTESEGQACYTEKPVFEKGALAEVEDDMRIWYPRILQGAEKLNAHARTFDKSKYRPLPLGTELPFLLWEEDQKKDWRYFVKLQNVNISGPLEEEEKECVCTWSIIGEREGEKEVQIYSILGVGVYALLELNHSCSIFEARQSVTKGCQATVYLDAVEYDIAAMAIDLTPPSTKEARRASMEFEMLFWEPIEEKETQ